MNEQDPDPGGVPLTRRQLRAAERARAQEQARVEEQARLEVAPTTQVAEDESPGESPPGTTTNSPTDPTPVSAESPAVPAPAGAPTAIDPQQALRTAEPPASRAGRDLRWAIGVGLVLGAVLVASLFIRTEGFVVLVALACGVALWELARAVRTRDIKIPLLPLLVGAAGILISAYTSGIEAMWVAFILTAGGTFVWRVLDGSGPPALRDATAAIFAAAYIPFLAGFVILMLTGSGPILVLTFIALVVANDVGGYAAGALYGKHPMAPTVSPKKSWEGVGGSILLTVTTGVALTVLALGGAWWVGVVFGLLTVVAATVGDLSESLLKRDLGVKDMGTVLPGHGGVLDRVDSILVAAPVVYVAQFLLLGT